MALEDDGIGVAPQPQAPVGEFTDARLAQTIYDNALAGFYCWTSALGWMKYNGCRWRECGDTGVIECIRRYLLDWLEDEDKASDEDRFKRVKNLLSHNRIAAIARLARGIAEVDARDFDVHHDLLNVRNGVVDLRTSELLPHDPKYLFTKITRVRYISDAYHEDWEKVLEAVPEDIVPWLQSRLGQAITGHVPIDDRILIMCGDGSNGKTTLMNAVTNAVGDYYTLISDKAILGNADSHTTELMDLKGTRLAFIEETPEARRLNIARVKKIAGTREITARRLYKDAVPFPTTHTLIINTNYVPIIEETDRGTWRRFYLVKYPYTFTARPKRPDERPIIEGLRERLQADKGSRARAALTWLIEGAKAWYEGGVEAPSRIVLDTHEWQSQEDLIAPLWNQFIEPDTDSEIWNQDLFDCFSTLLEMDGKKQWNSQTFAQRFQAHEITKRNGIIAPQTTRISDRLSRPDRPNLEHNPKVTNRVWKGIRFRLNLDRHIII